MLKGQFIFLKEVDWSVLHEGFSISVTFQNEFQKSLGKYLLHGERQEINLVIDGISCFAELINQPFNREKYPTHSDVIQIRYSQKSQCANILKQIFHCSYKKLSLLKNEPNKKRIPLSEHEKEYLAIYSSDSPYCFELECITSYEKQDAVNSLSKMEELTIENLIEKDDPAAEIIFKTGLIKMRKLNRAIGNELKDVYNDKCQVCGKSIGELYGVNISHIHHIEPFINTQNNNVQNLMVLCPNHHSIIHCAKPEFSRSSLTFIYPNNYKEPLLLNKHLL